VKIYYKAHIQLTRKAEKLIVALLKKESFVFLQSLGVFSECSRHSNINLCMRFVSVEKRNMNRRCHCYHKLFNENISLFTPLQLRTFDRSATWNKNHSYFKKFAHLHQIIIFDHLKLNDKYTYHVLQKSVTLRFVLFWF
jgi:hypothetical protein